MKRDDLNLESYPFTIRPVTKDEGEGYLIEYPDVPLCLADGATPEEAIANGRDALRSCLLCYREDGKPLPKPSSLAGSSGQFRLRVPKGLHAWLTASAEREGVSLNTLAVSLLAEGRGRRDEREVRGKTVRKVARGSLRGTRSGQHGPGKQEVA
jgi:antitoxin HicB